MGGALSFTHTSPCFSAHWKAVAQARGAEGSPPWGITVQVPHPLNCQPAARHGASGAAAAEKMM